MKGIIFTEFLDLVEKKFGIGMVDKIIAQSELKSAGAYTAVGTYDFVALSSFITSIISSSISKIFKFFIINC